MKELSVDEEKLIKNIPLKQLVELRLDIVSLDYADKLASYKNKKIAELDKEYKELKKQIEKMKCCGNCKHHSFWGDELKCKLIEYDCQNLDKWELAE